MCIKLRAQHHILTICQYLYVLHVCEQYMQVLLVAAPCQGTAWVQKQMGVYGKTHEGHQRDKFTQGWLYSHSLFKWQGLGSLWAKSWPTCWCRTGDCLSPARPDDRIHPIIVQGLDKHTLALLDATSVGADQHLENQITSNASIPALINGRAECSKWSSILVVIVIMMNAAQRHCHNKFQCA